MKPNLYLPTLLTLLSLLLTTKPAQSQSDSTVQKPKKQSAFGQFLKETGEGILRESGVPV